jgi:uncharacterized damage-inducible protein DinB
MAARHADKDAGVRGYVCPECGLDYDTVSPNDAKVAIRSFPRRFRSALAEALEDDADQGLIRRRPSPGVWSALEYTAHVADIFDAMADIIREMRTRDHPSLSMFDPDARAAASRYNEQDPQDVLERLRANAERLANELDQVATQDWLRTATFPFGERDILTMARNAVHEGSHHLRDVQRVLQQARAVGTG